MYELNCKTNRSTFSTKCISSSKLEMHPSRCPASRSFYGKIPLRKERLPPRDSRPSHPSSPASSFCNSTSHRSDCWTLCLFSVITAHSNPPRRMRMSHCWLDLNPLVERARVIPIY
ncbi:hypothetical protein BDW74DRAFT_95634 [Aspergillus multicolor]|uniref:uncharacterized protein n=1 Tax=Aspergillus multicolor TaxID=41759 RepID=UPI003CCD5B4A